MNKIDMYCVTDKDLPFLHNLPYKLAGVGKSNFSEKYLRSDIKKNIFMKEKYYSELTFHYWFWKNLLNISENKWIGFCQKRRFWINTSSEGKNINVENINEHLLEKMPKNFEKYDSVICKPISLSGVKKTKIIKRGWKNLLINPSIFINEKKQTIQLHFDMHHGYGNLKKALELVDDNDREDFKIYVNQKNFFNPNIMFISKPEIIDKWFTSVFSWLSRCEDVFGFENLKGYDQSRLYAYLAERYLSFWFKKHTNFIESPWITLEI
jgi:hypothetical protein